MAGKSKVGRKHISRFVSRELRPGAAADLEAVREELRTLLREGQADHGPEALHLGGEQRYALEVRCVRRLYEIMETCPDAKERRLAADTLLRHGREVDKLEVLAQKQKSPKHVGGDTINQLILHVEHGTPADVIATMLLARMHESPTALPAPEPQTDEPTAQPV